MLDASNNWEYTFEDLDQYYNGTEIVYWIAEEDLPNYSSEIVPNEDGSYTIIYTNTSTRSIPVEKRWQGKPLSSVTIRLFADGQEADSVILNADNAWKHTFANVPQYDLTDGHEIVYTVAEDAVNGYTADISGDMKQGFIVTNTEKPSPPSKPPRKPQPTPPRKPQAVPQTGDPKNIRIYLIGLLISGLGLGLIGLIYKRKREKREDDKAG